MSDQGSSHLGPDESIQRENAERLLADVADVVLLLVGAYASKILPKILPHLPITVTLPPHFLDELDELATMYGSLMDWATEALEHAGEPQPRRAAGEAVPVYDFQRLNELDRQAVQALVALGNAWLAVGEAARQLAAIRPDDRDGQLKARLALDEATKQLIAASARRMLVDDERASLQRPERVQIEAAPPVHSHPSGASRFRSNFSKVADPPSRPTGPAQNQARRTLHPEASNGDIRPADHRPGGAAGGRPDDRSRVRAARHVRTSPEAGAARRDNRFGPR